MYDALIFKIQSASFRHQVWGSMTEHQAMDSDVTALTLQFHLHVYFATTSVVDDGAQVGTGEGWGVGCCVVGQVGKQVGTGDGWDVGCCVVGQVGKQVVQAGRG